MVRLNFIEEFAIGAGIVLTWYGIDMWRDRRCRPTVIVTAEDVAVCCHGTVTASKWCDIRRVELQNRGCSHFGVVLFGTANLEIWDHYRGFEKFAPAVLGRWPDIKPEWLRMFDATEERVTVWERA